MKKKLLFTVLSLISIRAAATEILIKVSNRVFQANIAEDVNIQNISSGNQIIDLLKNSEIKEVIVSKHNRNSAHPTTWTEPKVKPMTWTEPK